MKRIIMMLMIQPMFVAAEAQFHVDADISGMPTTYKTEMNEKSMPQKLDFQHIKLIIAHNHLFM